MKIEEAVSVGGKKEEEEEEGNKIKVTVNNGNDLY